MTYSAENEISKYTVAQKSVNREVLSFTPFSWLNFVQPVFGNLRVTNAASCADGNTRNFDCIIASSCNKRAKSEILRKRR